MQKIREMVDVNTIIGTPIRTDDGITLVPVSKLSFGFASGGSDFVTKNQKPEADNAFGGGGGAGVNISPVAFLIVKGDTVKLLPVAPPANTTVDRVVELVDVYKRQVSALTGATVKRGIAMTGEITLRGRVLPIGGLREKTMAALRNGCLLYTSGLPRRADGAGLRPAHHQPGHPL